ncbi:ATP-dependent helicase HrpB [Enterovibrio nigricans]|uniref:ATP-dependent helicase HrpB n=1 Tax=Enterovibrio nigricans DSM 22720 TaxID=1121868 RepID=A0A1T4TXL8_9GAMM|nr:ATP-dependent helicase HrpB [Enterovibrio nigricans]PKF49502.1 ATP-dependent helicase HrpB [Enterovibrio nigricans]SKA45193.1 ATP-dependent helicase HrpB [Enterovibrio nigricans DSM 22720]
MSQLPIDSVLDNVISALGHNAQVILKAPPGAGKSTRLPLVLLEKNVVKGRIILLEPRRLAARNIARFLAKQRGESVGETVGLRVRGETRVSDKTRIEIVTEGVLTRMIQSDPELQGVDLVIFDEFHERNLHADLAFALSLDVQAGLRDDLTLLIMSATLDDGALSELLPTAEVLTSEGRSFPVEARYQSVPRQYGYESVVASAIAALLDKEEGSALVFLPGVREIQRTAEALRDKVAANVLICPLFGQLSPKEQQDAIAPAPQNRRKVVLATNIAETSLTIEGIRLVVDSGLERVARFNRKTSITKLETLQIAKSSAIQRMGRAGRLSEGICLRLYGEDTYQRMQTVPEPEMVSSDLTQLVLEVIQWGCSPEDLQWLDAPPTAHWQQALMLLRQLGLVDERGGLSATGKQLNELGVEARLGAMLLTAKRLDKRCLSTACWLAAWAEEPLRGKADCDLRLQLMQVASRKGSHSQRAQQLADRIGCRLTTEIDGDLLPLLAASAWPDRIAKSRGNNGRFLLSNGHGAQIDTDHPLSAEDALIAVDLMSVAQGDSRIFTACRADFAILQTQLPSLFSEQEWVDWDEKKGRLVAETQLRCGDIVVSRKPITQISDQMRTQAVLQQIKRKGLASLSLNAKAESLLNRARCANVWALGLPLPSLDEQDLLEALDDWLLPFLGDVTSLGGLKTVDIYRALEAWFGWDATKELNRLLPETYEVPTGSSYKIRYQSDAKPALAVKMQEMYGQAQSPSIADGKVTLVVELLSPAQRPLQITQDLAGFWRGAYKDVQKEMKGRYPKRNWDLAD